MLAYGWPGNVRELANALERAAILTDGDTIGAEQISVRLMTHQPPSGTKPIAELERDAIEQALAQVGGNRRLAAEQLGIGLRTLYEKLKRYGMG